MTDNNDKLVPNEPEKFKGAGLSGPQKNVSRAEAKQRAIVMDKLLQKGKSDIEIEEVMAKQFEMEPTSTQHLMSKRLQAANLEYAARNPYMRATTIRRIYEHIDSAKKDRRWGDIANLEKVLAGVSGTMIDPKEQASPSDQRLNEATLRILNESDPKEIMAIIDRQRVYILGDKKTDLTKEIINITEDSKCLRSRQ